MSLERRFHDTIWKAANDSQVVEQALRQARDLATAVRDNRDHDLLDGLAADLLEVLDD